MTVRAKTTSSSNTGSFAPEHRAESGVELLADLVTDPATDSDWAAAAWEEVIEEQQAIDYLRDVLTPDRHHVPPRDEPRHPVNECTGADLPRIAYLGKTAYDPGRVQPIKNIVGFSKPSGGTWLSPLNDDGTTAWTEHCKVIRFDAAVRGRRVHPIGLHPEARVLKIDSMEDLRGVIDTHGGIQREGDTQLRPDFEEIARHYDALWLTRRGMNATWMPADGRRAEENLNSWELESVLILNPDAVHST